MKKIAFFFFAAFGIFIQASAFTNNEKKIAKLLALGVAQFDENSQILTFGRASNDAIAKIGRYQVFYLGVCEVAHVGDTLKLGLYVKDGNTYKMVRLKIMKESVITNALRCFHEHAYDTESKAEDLLSKDLFLKHILKRLALQEGKLIELRTACQEEGKNPEEVQKLQSEMSYLEREIVKLNQMFEERRAKLFQSQSV